MSNSSQEIYRANIIDHYQNPRNHGPLANADVTTSHNNPLCGDDITIHLKLDSSKTKIEKMNFEGTGCAISQAAASILTEKVSGMEIKDVKNITQEELFSYLGINPGPARIKCATLALETLKESLSSIK